MQGHSGNPGESAQPGSAGHTTARDHRSHQGDKEYQSPFISVIIPTYNRAALVAETVASVRAQTFRDFEIIVVNDGSTDDTGQWLAKQQDIRAVQQPNRGIAASRNNGAAIARGRWLAFLDHDDIWDPDKLMVQAEFVEHNPDVGLVALRHVRLGKRYRDDPSSKWIKGDLLVKEYSESFIHTSSVLIRADVFREIGGFPTRYRFADEFDVWLKIAARYPVAYLDRALVFIRFYEANTSHNRIGVRTDTYDILMNNYDPARIPRSVFLRTMSDHDISFGRAYAKAGLPDEAGKWFASSVRRTPWRPRSWRYYLRHKIACFLSRGSGQGMPTPTDGPTDPMANEMASASAAGDARDDRSGPGQFEVPGGEAVNLPGAMTIHPDAGAVLGLREPLSAGKVMDWLGEHRQLVASGAPAARKNSPESAVTVFVPSGCRTAICVKELKWRGMVHSLKGLFRRTQGLRTFENGWLLLARGFSAARPLALLRQKTGGLVTAEWIVMEALANAREMDRYILAAVAANWSMEERRSFAFQFGHFMGTLHRAGVFHADLKTCNILVDRLDSAASHTHAPLTGPEPAGTVPGPVLRFTLVDYDDCRFSATVSFRHRVKNLVQIFLSTPLVMGASDRMRFIRAYGRSCGLSRADRRNVALEVLKSAKEKTILYVGFDGDVIERWDT